MQCHAPSHDAPATRTLHRLSLPARLDAPGDAPLRRGLVADCETTGADWVHDEVVEVGLLPFTYTPDGRVVEVLHGEAQTHLRDPGRALPAGRTAAQVRGRHIDVGAASALIERSDLVVAHNARFDRPFIEQVLPSAREKPWACSRLEVPWRASGAPSDALHCLLCHYGAFAAGRHRALADCEATLWLLARTLPGTTRPVLGALLERSAVKTVRLWAVASPIEAKGLLRARGYRWMPEPRGEIPRGWWTEVAPELVEAEQAWLRAAVYRAGPQARTPVVLRRVSARERWRSDPADCAGWTVGCRTRTWKG